MGMVIPSAKEILGEQLANNLAELQRELEYTQMLLQAILRHVGSPAHCKFCGAPILWVRHLANGKSMPYNYDGLIHFSACSKEKNATGIDHPASK
jgi:hypothetical protein